MVPAGKNFFSPFFTNESSFPEDSLIETERIPVYLELGNGTDKKSDYLVAVHDVCF